MENNTKGQSKGNKMFFVAVVVSLSMIILACIIAYPQIISPETENQLAEVSDTTTTDETAQEYNPVDNIVTNVPKSTTSVVDTPTTTAYATTTEDIITTQTTIEPLNIPLDDSPIMPLAEYTVLNEFSNGELVKSATSGIWQTHNGVDFSASMDTAVQAVADGTVTKVYEDALLGVCVTIDHTDFTANYCNLGVGVIVVEGDTVEKGSIIGTVGDTSTSESALDSHLHFETIKDGSYINPLDIIVD
jgi:murein DD-endopeptidase MepM/ murein hydrolase activator NlpD